MATLERYDSIAYRIVEGEIVVGMALQMATGKWRAFNDEEKPMSVRNFDAPRDVLAWWNENARVKQ